MIVWFGWIGPISSTLEIDSANWAGMRTEGKSACLRQTRPIQSVASLPLNTVYNGGRPRKWFSVEGCSKMGAKWGENWCISQQNGVRAPAHSHSFHPLLWLRASGWKPLSAANQGSNKVRGQNFGTASHEFGLKWRSRWARGEKF